MTREPVVTIPDAMAYEALKLMEDRPSQIAVLPVVESGPLRRAGPPSRPRTDRALVRLPCSPGSRRPALSERYDEGRTEAPLVERLPDDELARLNELLPWRCFTVDSQGRAFGGRRLAGKAGHAQPIPDRRIVLFDERFDLSDKHVLEVGCFEGVHTIALSRRAQAVTAVDARVENVVKTVVRCAFFDERPRVPRSTSRATRTGSCSAPTSATTSASSTTCMTR